MIIKDWWYAIKACHKYKILWTFCGKHSDGTYFSQGTLIHDCPVICINPFSRHFKEIFLHELGHHIAKRVGFEDRYREYDKNTSDDDAVLLKGKSYFITLDEEAFASRFARKASKGSVNTEVLVKWFQTYCHSGYRSKHVNNLELTDKVSKLIKRIQK